MYSFLFYFIVPTVPQNFTSISTKTSVTFKWEEPAIPNGIITYYSLSVSNLNTSYTTNIIIEDQIMDDEFKKVISGFSPYQSYNASITASTIIGAGPPATTTGRTEPDSKQIKGYAMNNYLTLQYLLLLLSTALVQRLFHIMLHCHGLNLSELVRMGEQLDII